MSLPKGLPKAYIKKWGISKTAWAKFRAGALTKGIRTRTKAIRSRLRAETKKIRRRKGGNPMAKKRRSRRSFTLPVAPILGIVAMSNANGAWDNVKSGDLAGAVEKWTKALTGYSPSSGDFDINRLNAGFTPIVVGFLVHWIAGKIGINRALGRAKVPVVRV